MGEGKDRIVRLLSCDLKAPTDITSDLLDHNLAWLWFSDYDDHEDCYSIEPTQGMYDFGLDDDVPSDWLVWSEHSDKSISVIQDFRVLHDLGVRGNFVINEIGTMTFEKWWINDLCIRTYVRKVIFDGDPDSVILISNTRRGCVLTKEEGDTNQTPGEE